MILKKNFLKNLLPHRDMSCSQNGNVGKLRDQNLIFRFFGRCLVLFSYWETEKGKENILIAENNLY